ncbi:peptidoglycan editing factor PgeF [Edaphobacter bradus]|uniref:peptidoglycan editing factor PgeF n=1 Tax=Edaphobacter bradus TaxID=2259016 RepID=UPI0021DFBBEF|nr:peptidoglycan editing factor PgeF [Edaphobacter bradus]
MAAADVVKVPGWEFDWLRHGFSTRSGGESSVYGGQTLNLGWTKEDDPEAVAANRRLFLQSLAGETNGMSGLRLVTIRQVHSRTVRVIRADDGALGSRLESPEGKAVLEGDGLVTDVPGVLVAVGTADCVPVLVVDEAKRAVGAFHAGWRGTVAKIVEQGVVTMQQEYGSRPEDLRAAIGPGIGACCYVVGDEVRSNFDAQFAYSGELFREAESSSNGRRQFYVNLWEANRRQLLASGIAPERIAVIGECTGCSRNAAGERRYFSHRVEHGVAGRMLNAIGVVA